MSFELTEDQELIRRSVAELSSKFDDHYWMAVSYTHLTLPTTPYV